MTAASIHEVHPAGWTNRAAVEWADEARNALAPLLAEEEGWAWRCLTEPDLDLVSEPGTARSELLAHACEALRGLYGDWRLADADPQRLGGVLRDVVSTAADDAWGTAFYAVSGDRDEGAKETQ
ncbi:hypothetical protein [Cellulomonas sp. Y8]|uniref:hypothetical protein n=1 Tax=Cellulomonas sp. Y8 TaxID=2591145 RepID=UPI003D745E0C